MKLKKLFLLMFIFLFIFSVNGFSKKKKKEKDYNFKIITKVKATIPKNQARTGTCWCFSTTSFLESEIMRMGKGEYNLSEMFTVRNNYLMKAINYIRMHGNATFGQGGQAHHVFKSIKKYGIVPESVYPGLNYGTKMHNHSELFRGLKGFLDSVLVNKWGAKITPVWFKAFTKIVDTYLGDYPTSFTYKGVSYTPKSFLKHLGLNPDEYLELTSYDLYPYYKKVRLEVPDNWDYDSDYYNVPIDDLEKIVDYAIKNGYSVVWDGDVSEVYYSPKRSGWAVVPAKWEDTKKKDRDKLLIPPVKEKDINQRMRTKSFLNFETSDDHLMHIVGIAKDQKGTKFYYTKNSGGPDRKYNGYVYLSRSFFRLKTIAIALHKDALPQDIRKKLQI